MLAIVRADGAAVVAELAVNWPSTNALPNSVPLPPEDERVTAPPKRTSCLLLTHVIVSEKDVCRLKTSTASDVPSVNGTEPARVIWVDGSSGVKSVTGSAS